MIAKNWKHTTKNRKQYEKWGGKRNTERYDTPFMMLDEETFKETETETKEVI